MRILLFILGITIGAISAPIAVAAIAAADSTGTIPDSEFDWSFLDRDETQWTVSLTTGLDAFVHTYSLATTDTTETIAEFLGQVALEGRSARRGRHRWSVRGEASIGTELFRERAEASYRLQDVNGATRVRIGSSIWGRQYRQQTDYALSSDNFESRLDLRVSPWLKREYGLELRTWNTSQHFSTPSTLEIDYHELGGGAYLRSRGLGDRIWSVGVLGTGRAYPDSSRIDRRTLGIQADMEHLGNGDSVLRLHHRTDRRLIEDETARPSAWIHGSDLDFAVPAGPGRVLVEMQSEAWSYDQETDTYFDSWRLDGFAGFGRGEVLATRWRVGVAGERLEAGDSPETYSQFGLRTGIEAYDRAISGSVTFELGQRLYDDAADENDTDTESASLTDAEIDYVFRYSDFTYWEIWLMAAWRINDHFTIDAMANYEPENHAVSGEDSALGYGSLRLTWRP